MRINRLNLTFGPFKNQELDFSEGRQGLHLIHGPNESGKTTTLRAIQQFFEGIEARSTDNYLTEHKNLRIGATLQSLDGSFLSAIRRKGNANTLLNSEGSPSEEAENRLKIMLGGHSANDFVNRFVLDHDRLKAGGKEIVNGGGGLGEMLFAAGTGVAGFGKVREQLDRDAQALYKKGGSNPEINRKQTALAELLKTVRETQLKGSTWTDLRDQLEKAEVENATLLEAIHESNRARARLDRIRSAIDAARDRRIVLEALGPLADAPTLAPDFRDRRLAALTSLRHSAEGQQTIQAKIERLRHDEALLDIPEDLLVHAARIEDLQARRLGFGKAKQGRIEQAGVIDLVEAQVRSTLVDLGRNPQDLADETLDAFRLKAADRALVRGLSEQRLALETTLKSCRAAITSWEKRAKGAADRVKELGAGRKPEAIDKALKACRKHGDLETSVQSDRKEQQKEQAKALRLLKQLSGWSGTLEEAEALDLPYTETIDTFRTKLDQAALELIAVEQKINDAKNDAIQVDSKIEESLNRFGEVPTEATLAEARTARDQYWKALKATWTPEIAATFERSIKVADDLVDRLRRETERVTLHGQFLADRSRIKGVIEHLQSERTVADARLNEQKGLWENLWKPLGIEPRSPVEMNAWSKKQAELAALAGAISDREKSIQEHESLILKCREQMKDVLKQAGESSNLDQESLMDLIERAEACIDTIHKEAKARDKVNHTLETLEIEEPKLKEDEVEALKAWETWQGRWRLAMLQIGLAEEADNHVADTVLSTYDQLFNLIERLRDSRSKLSRSEDEIRRFEGEVADLLTKLPDDLATDSNDPPEIVINRLNERLGQARKDQHALAGLAIQIKEAAEELERVREANKAAEAALKGLCVEASCERVDDLEATEKRSEERRSLEARRSRIDEELHKLSTSSDLQAFLLEVEAADPDGLDLKIARLDETIQRFKDGRDSILQMIGELTAEKKRWDGDGKAASAAQQAEDLRAEIKGNVEEYIRLRLASALLREGMERYRKKAQGPVLDRASELFTRLTLGSFQGLTIDFDNQDNPVLRAVRQGGESPLDVSALSLGTADQLYFALRLATLETNLNGKEPLPLVVDDVLIQFDDERAIATLKILAELSNQTQILMFTHHDHLVDIARRHLDSKVLFTHPLDRLWKS